MLWFLGIILLVVLVVSGYIIWDLQKAKTRLKTYSQGLENTVLLQEQKGVGLYEQIEMLKDQVDEMKHQRATVNRMVELGFLKVTEDHKISKDKLPEASKDSNDSNVIQLGRHAE
jgi:hypothetical protein